MWSMPIPRLVMVNESKAGSQFVRFVNMLMNDTTFLLDECLEYLKRIHETQVLQMDETAWAALGNEMQQTRQRQLAQDERQCRSYLTLARETVDMFHYLTVDIKEPFMCPELIDRLASMLNFNMRQLCGPKCKDLKVRSPQKFGWDPRRLLSQLFDIYLHLDCDKFAEAIAADERSFEKDFFHKVADRINDLKFRSSIEVERFRDLVNLAHAKYGKPQKCPEGKMLQRPYSQIIFFFYCSGQSTERRRFRRRARRIPRPADGHADERPGSVAVRHNHGSADHHAASAEQQHRPVQSAAAHRGDAAAGHRASRSHRGVEA